MCCALPETVPVPAGAAGSERKDKRRSSADSVVQWQEDSFIASSVDNSFVPCSKNICSQPLETTAHDKIQLCVLPLGFQLHQSSPATRIKTSFTVAPYHTEKHSDLPTVKRYLHLKSSGLFSRPKAKGNEWHVCSRCLHTNCEQLLSCAEEQPRAPGAARAERPDP